MNMKRTDMNFTNTTLKKKSEDGNTQNLKKSLLYYVAKMSTNTIDSRIKLFTEPLQELHETFERSDLQTAIANKGVTASINGDYFMVGTFLEGKPYFLTFDIINDNWESVGRDYTRMVVDAERPSISKEGMKTKKVWIFEVLKKDSFYDGKLIKAGRVVRKGGELSLLGKVEETEGDVYVYPEKFKNRIPGVRVRNSYDSLGDLEHISYLLDMTSNFMDKLPFEYEWQKTLLSTNDNYGVGDAMDEIIQGVESSGRKIKGGELGNGQLGAQVGLFKEGGTAVDILMSLIGSINDLIFKLGLISRDTDSTGTNKHGTEVALFNQAASEFIEAKIRQRQIDISYFLKTFGSLFVDKLEIADDYRIEFDLSDFEEGKRVALREAQATIELKLAQAEYSKSQGKRQLAEIELGKEKLEIEKTSIKKAEAMTSEKTPAQLSIRENIQ